jgi:hypothetical protein
MEAAMVLDLQLRSPRAGLDERVEEPREEALAVAGRRQAALTWLPDTLAPRSRMHVLTKRSASVLKRWRQ